ncbi:hypothetical protein MM326_04655 [Alkalihalobacillus sp. LMS6]|uniref:metallophosphoesterase n=1 Tax=Alkalihalobacillus sp. LMS6 TaxID=2924034 RepID=UPI0020D06BE2|nr:metallophosphoesterase [Alkalihalobacillus sp. LMS6]UTR07327.1 hypothetical protein MM326_04655 [Alkalihalobacillus sp. LMS6]
MSDIHGDLDLLKKLLVKMNVREQDILMMNGDLCEKGPNSLGVIRYVMDLCHQQSVYITLGNNDAIMLHLLHENEKLMPYLQRQPFSLIHEMLAEKQQRLENFSSIKEVSLFCKQHFLTELNWLNNLLHAYESEQFIIIHAGIEKRADWRQTTLMNAYALPSFYTEGHLEHKMVVVGHWPTNNYLRDEGSHHNPIIDHKQRILSLDGGLHIKQYGQLNGVTLENGIFHTTYVDHLTRVKQIIQPYANNKDRGTISWPHYAVEKKEERTHFTLCYHRIHETTYWIKNEHLVFEDETWQCKGDVSATFLTVREGETVYMLDDQCSGYDLVKKDGYIGWIPKACT